jgi:hypothetical protein
LLYSLGKTKSRSNALQSLFLNWRANTVKHPGTLSKILIVGQAWAWGKRSRCIDTDLLVLWTPGFPVTRCPETNILAP